MGYKVLNISSASWKVISGFIWTIWDIKHIDADDILIHASQFYLNHMGYKEFFIKGRFNVIYSFIWTIWDIKVSASNSFTISVISFYLNHMGYKVHYRFIKLLVIRTFYLNHMGYKGNILDNRRISTESFIWTIWDIKLYYPLLITYSLIVLSEPYGI